MENADPQASTHVAGDVSTNGGDFIGRDQIIHGNKVKVSSVELTDVTASGDINIHDIHVGFTYTNVSPRPVDATTMKEAKARLAKLPVKRIPSVAPLPPGSRMPHSLNPLFVGRQDDLRTLAVALKGGKTVAVGQIAAATGLGGIGKTQLAVAFVHYYGQFFAGGVHWLNFDDPKAVATEVTKCGSTMPDVRQDFAHLDFETQVSQVLAAWQSPLPRLLIFDNCEDSALLAHWRPLTGGSRVLVTSRRQSWDAALGVSVVSLDTLLRTQSIELLRKFRPDLSPTDHDLDQIADELGDLPLALHLAGNYLARYRYEVTPAQYLAQLQQPDLLKHRSLQVGDLSPTGHVQHVERTFAISYERLNSADPVDSMALALLARAACFAPGQLIPRSLLLATIRLNAEDALQAADALQQLANLGLLEMETVGNRLMHRLVMHFVQAAALSAPHVAQHAVAIALLAEANRLNKAGVPGPLLVWQSHLRHITETNKDQADETAAGLCNTIGFHLQMLGDYAAARPYYERALAIREAGLGPKHPETATSLNALGDLLKLQCDYTPARLYYERALAIREEVLGPKHPETAASFNALGSVIGIRFQHKNHILTKGKGAIEIFFDYRVARPFYEHALAIREEVLGPKHPETATSLNALGDLLKLQGDHATTQLYYERALAIREEVLGPKHPETAASLNDLGDLLKLQGDHATAQLYYKRALAIREEALGPGHPYTAASLESLIKLLNSTGDYTTAQPYLERFQAIENLFVFSKYFPSTYFPSTGRWHGTVKTVTDKGFGFISIDEFDKDVFYRESSITAINQGDLNVPKVGDEVSFFIEESVKGIAAIKLQITTPAKFKK